MTILPGVWRSSAATSAVWLRGDVVAGLTVAAYLVPQVMAYATVAGLPPVVGLWAALAPLAVYAVLGSSRQLSVGPESTTALMTATALAPLAAGDPASTQCWPRRRRFSSGRSVSLPAWCGWAFFLSCYPVRC